MRTLRTRQHTQLPTPSISAVKGLIGTAQSFKGLNDLSRLVQEMDIQDNQKAQLEQLISTRYEALYARYNVNQCDGCMQGNSADSKGYHRDSEGNTFMRCTRND